MNALVERVAMDIMSSGLVHLEDGNGDERVRNFSVGSMTRQDQKWIIHDL